MYVRCWATTCSHKKNISTFCHPKLVLTVFSGPSPVFHILGISRTGPVSSPLKKGNRTRTGPEFKALSKSEWILSKFWAKSDIRKLRSTWILVNIRSKNLLLIYIYNDMDMNWTQGHWSGETVIKTALLRSKHNTSSYQIYDKSLAFPSTSVWTLLGTFIKWDGSGKSMKSISLLFHSFPSLYFIVILHFFPTVMTSNDLGNRQQS